MMSMTTSWMWRNDEMEIEGADIDAAKGVINFADGIGCACGDSAFQQTFADFLKVGARYVDPPADVLAEMRAAVQTLVAQPA
jgi:hypothetical protein